MFQFGLVPTINKPTSVTNKTISAIDHIITNSIFNNDFKTAIIRTDISDHFPITNTFFYKQPIFDPRPENCLSFSKKSPSKIV